MFVSVHFSPFKSQYHSNKRVNFFFISVFLFNYLIPSFSLFTKPMASRWNLEGRHRFKICLLRNENTCTLVVRRVMIVISCHSPGVLSFRCIDRRIRFTLKSAFSTVRKRPRPFSSPPPLAPLYRSCVS